MSSNTGGGDTLEFDFTTSLNGTGQNNFTGNENGLSYTAITNGKVTALPAVPLPPTVWMLIGGLSLLGLTAVRRSSPSLALIPA